VREPARRRTAGEGGQLALVVRLRGNRFTHPTPVTVELPRDRDASFEPRIVPNHARSFDGFDEQILALYAGGLTTREIQRHLRELYRVEVSDGLISEVTASIQDEVRAWQSRPLEELYVVVYLDALQVAIRDQQVVPKKAVYVAIGVTLEGTRDCLGLWIEKREGARLWTSVLTELRNPRRKDALRLHRRPLRLPGGDRRRLPAGRQPDLHHPPRPPVAALPLLEGTQELRQRAAADLHRSRRRRGPASARRAPRRVVREQDAHRRAAGLGGLVG
jgi:Transposase, Mutator family